MPRIGFINSMLSKTPFFRGGSSHTKTIGGDTSLRIYKIVNKFTHERREVKAKSFDEACRKLGWPTGECRGRIITARGIQNKRRQFNGEQGN